MTRDDVIRLAREAGYGWSMTDMHAPALARFAALVVAAEREACLNCYSPDDTATDWADKIRARGEPGP
jgi:hypothetical protein